MTKHLTLVQWLMMAGIILMGLFLFPVLFATTFLSKLLITLVSTLVLMGIIATKSIISNKLTLVITPITGALLALAITTAATIFFTQPYPVTGLFGMGGFVLWSALFGWLLASLLQPEAEAAEDRGQLVSWTTQLQYRILVGLGVVAVGLVITGALENMGIGPASWLNGLLGINLPTDLRFSLTGSPLAAAQFGGLAAVGWIFLSWQQKRWTPMSVTFILAGLLSLVMNVWAMLPNHVSSIVLPNWSVSWTLILDTLRTPRTALIGFGTESYGNVLNKFKPIWVNGTPNWDLNFSSASNWPFTLLVTQGVIGFLAWVWLVVTGHKVSKQAPTQLLPLVVLLGLTLVLQIFLPLQITILFLQMIILAGLASSFPSNAQVIQIRPKHWWPAMVGWVLAAGILGVGFYYARLALAYYHLFEADRAAYKNQPTQLYDHHRQAVLISPYIDLVRRQYALTNLQLALVLSTNKNATEADRAQITQLVGQAVREAKAATIIDPTNSQNWIVLAEIYRNLSTAVKEANQWTVAALVSAIETAPTNPGLRLELGQVLLDQNLLTESGQIFNQAIELKPDLPGGYYQLGRVYRAANQLDKTQLLWQKTLSLLPADSQQYQAVNTNLKDLAAEIQATFSAKKAPTVPTPTPAAESSESALLRLTKDSPSNLLNSNLPVSGEDPLEPVADPSLNPSTAPDQP